MANYFLSSSNQTFSIYENKIVVNNGSGSVNSGKKECTYYWFTNQNELTIADILNISQQVTGSSTYLVDSWRL